MADFNYRGCWVTDDWPTASRVKGAIKPSTERYFTFYGEDGCIWANTQREMKERIAALFEEGTNG
jgi:hypothetical protein